MKHIPYKYKLHTLLRKLSVDDFQIAMKFLPEKCGVKPRTFKYWIYRKLDDATDIPSEAIFIMSVFFGVEPHELYEKPINKNSLIDEFVSFKEEYFNQQEPSLNI